MGKTTVQEMSNTKYVVYFIFAVVSGFFANAWALEWAVEKTAKWMNVAASTLDTPFFIISIIAIWFLASKFGKTLKVVISGIVFGFIIRWLVVLYCESNGIELPWANIP